MIVSSLKSNNALIIATIVALVCLLPILGCGSTDTSEKSSNQSVNEAIEPLFPFNEFVAAELAYLEATPLAIVKYIEEDNVPIDRALITVEEVKEIAKAFTPIDPNESQWRPLFTETSFVDATLGYNTFVITASQAGLPMQQATILLHPETNQVERLLVETVSEESLQKRLTWKRHESLQIVELFPDNHIPKTRVTKLVWNE